MYDTVETVRIVSTDPATQGPFVEINATDFDEAVHKLYVEADPLDHDGDGRKGGSVPKGKAKADADA